MTFTDTFLEERDSIPIFVPDKKEKRMEIVTIEAKKVWEICGENSRSMDDWIDNQEACMLMGVSPGKLLQLRRRRALPYSHIDRKVYYRRQDIIRFMENTIRQVIL